MEGLSNRKTVRLSGYNYSTPGAYFLTLCTENRKCVLSRISVGPGVLDGPNTGAVPCCNPTVGTGVLDGPNIELLPRGKIAEKILRQLDAHYEHIGVDSYVIMPNHIHILLSVFEQVSTGGPSGRPVPTGAKKRRLRVSFFMSF